MSELKEVDVGRLVKLIKKAQKKMPEPPNYTEKAASCWRCNGTGVYKWGGSLNGVARFQGPCYRCCGNGVDPKDKIYTIDLDNASPEWIEWATEKIAKLEKAKEKRIAKKEAKLAAEVAEKDKELSDRLESLKAGSEALRAAEAVSEALGKVDGFAYDVLETVLKKGYMSEKQEEILKRGAERVAQRAAENADAKPVVEGRIEILGVVKTTKWQENEQYGGSLKMLVLDDRGFKLWGTVPSSLQDIVDPEKQPWEDGYSTTVKKGDKIKFVATVEKSPDDECFGFYKRPTKAAVVENVA